MDKDVSFEKIYQTINDEKRIQQMKSLEISSNENTSDKEDSD